MSPPTATTAYSTEMNDSDTGSDTMDSPTLDVSGLGHSPFNGSTANGSTANGLTANGSTVNGSASNGVHINGNSTAGSTTNGSTVNGVHVNGSTTNGSTVNGVHINGKPTNGSTTNGSTVNGVHVNGSTTNGSTVNGVHVNGSTTNGSTANGVHINGKPTNGSTTNGSTLNGVHINGKPTNGTVTAAEPIAICGMGLRLPGALHTPQQLWDFLVSKGDARGRVPSSRYNVSAYYSPTGKPGTTKTEYGYFLDESVNLGSLDTQFFSMRRGEIDRADPQQRQLLEVVRECMEDAGETNWRGALIGCYMGTFGEDWNEIYSKEIHQYGQYRVTGYGDFMPPNRISFEMDLRGPSMIIRTGCSASLIALHEACLAISRGDCTSAIVGGANLIMAPGMTTAMSEQGVLAPDGSCKTFSADADGYARGEAISAIYIKPLADAIRDGNPVRAVIRSTASNCNGQGLGGASAPSAEAQEAMIRRAYHVAGISDFSQTAFVECHGTGTPVGDPIETNAVASVFGPAGGVYIGSVKPNLGHSEGASGLTSLMKAVLSLENQTIPPNIKFSAPNPKIQFESANLTVPTEPTPWPQSRCERVSVNSFGIGGSNAHVILDSARSFGVSSMPKGTSDTPHLLVYSANSPDSLEKLVGNYREFMENNPERIGDLSYTLSNRREHLSHRAFSVVNICDSGTVSPTAKVAKPHKVVMIFTGQGAQWPQMGRELLQNHDFSVFKKSIRSLDKHLQAMPFAPEWSIEEELLKSPKKSQLGTAELSQPLCTALQIALVDTLSSVGIEPSAVVGHSSGEVAAAYAAGAITAKEAIAVAYYRGYVAKKQTRSGAMAAIGMGREDVQNYLTLPGVTIACENSPKNVTLSGDAENVKAVVRNIQESRPDVLARLLKVDKAYHCHHMAEIGGDYYDLIYDKVMCAEPAKLFFSSVTGEIMSEGTSLGPKYWQKNLESPVLFRAAVASILQHEVGQNAVFLEVGPHSALAGPLRQIQNEHSNTAPYVSAMARNQNCIESFLTAVGKLYSLKVPIDFKTLIPNGATLSDLPRYPWSHTETYWYESRLSKEWRQRQYPCHDLLGVRLPESTEFDPVWRNLFHLDNAPWVRDHKVRDDIVFPFASYAAMIGEAVRQITGVQEAFSLRRVVVSSALVLTEGKPTEIMTALRRQRLTDYLDSEWWEFTIASHNGHIWMKHCTGQVKAQTDSLGPAQDPLQYPRKVASRRCYESMAQSGLNFGPAFQRLEEVWSGTTEQVATATAKALNRQDDEASYHLHPTLIDSSMQLLSVAATKGYTGQGPSSMLVPTNIEELSVYRCSSDITMTASAAYIGGGAIVGSGQCTFDGEVVLRISGLRLSTVDEDSQTDGSDSTARSEWGPHIDFLDAKQLIKPSIDRALYTPALDELSQLCMVHSQRLLRGLKTELAHMQKFQAWIDRHLESTGLPELANLDDAAISDRVNSLVRQLSTTAAVDAATAIHKVFTNIAAIFTGEMEALEILLADETLTKLYRFGDEIDRSLFLQNIAHSRPNLRVLEIGAGTGATTRTILNDLAASDQNVLYSKYTFTDISSGLFVSAKEQFKAFPNMEYATLDISKDPADQGFEGRQFDLIVAVNVIHATKTLQDSLRNVRKLLHPNGRFLLTEINTTSKWVNYIWGTLQGWWYGEGDGRPDEPYVSTERWKSELLAAGFEGLDAVVLDSEEPFQLNATMIAKPRADKTPEKRVTLLCCDETSNPGPILKELEKSGYTVTKSSLNEIPLPAGQDVIAILDMDGPFFENIDAARFESFKNLINNIGSSGIMWVTNLCQMHCKDPRYAQVIGTARTIRSEMLIDFATCEVDDIESSSDLIAEVFHKFQRREEDETLKPEFEYAIYNRRVNIGRIYPFSLEDELLTSESSDKIILQSNKPGRLSNLHWSRQADKPPQDNDVEVETYSTGLNFKDVLCAMGILKASKDGFGLEAAGVVRRTGPKVKDLRVGDRVMLIGHGAFATLVTTPEPLCVKMPDDLDFDDGATMPCVYATAIYSLFNIGGLQRGESILIHSACGGVGIAAIQLAQMVGAEIYATVGNDDKVQYLMNTFHLPRNRIFNSRNISFVEGLMRETQGKGVDLALNSLSGELLHATWRCVAEFGKMVEIGKRDLIGAGKLDMEVFLANRSYCCVDLDQVCSSKPSICKELLKSTIEYLEAGHILPIRPIKAFGATSIEEAFRYMQQGQHMGKIVISIRDPSGEVNLGTEIQRRKEAVSFDSSASYLLVGGLGGLGRSVSTWMVEKGARRLIYLSRSAGATSEQHQEFIRELESMGCEVQLVQGSVSNADDVGRAVERAQGNLKGILQMSMVLCDQALPRMTLEEWNTVTTPKIEGTWNLHNATVSAGANLDFFVLFSSISGVIGHPGQANYAGANTFLDSFVQYRTGMGLPVSTIDIGAVEEVGYIARNQVLLRRLKTSGVYGIVSEHDLLESIAGAMTGLSRGTIDSTNDQSRFVARNNFSLGLRSPVPLSSPENRAVWRKDIRMAVFHNSVGTSTESAAASSDVLKSFLSKARNDPAILKSPEAASLLALEIGKKLFSLLLRSEEDLQTSCSLADLGMDSLVAIEMRSWWKQTFNFDVSVLEMLGMGTLDALGQHACQGLLRLHPEGHVETDGSSLVI